MGLTHVDAGVVIAFLDADDAHHAAARSVLDDTLDRGDELSMAASALAECLVGPARRGPTTLDTVRGLVQRMPIAVVAIDDEIAARAARLRARHRSLKLPDALVIATADHDGADRLVTTDRGWPTRRDMNLAASVVQL